jgi:Ca2+/Na+ antiporter
MSNNKQNPSVDNEQVAFEYFKIYSAQRTTHFNYFLVGVTALLATLVDKELSTVQITVLGLFLSCLSTVFYYFDLRNKELIKISEDYLSNSKDGNSENFFSFVESETQLRRRDYSLIRRLFRSHGRVYEILYFSFFLTGVAFIVYGLIIFFLKPV